MNRKASHPAKVVGLGCILLPLTLGACDAGGEGITAPENAAFQDVVLDETGAPVSGATVALWANNRRYSDLTGSDGAYFIEVPADQFPRDGEVAMSVVKDGYRPRTATYAAPIKNLTRYGFGLALVECPTCLPTSSPSDSELIHLGDDNFGGSVNSQFQKSADDLAFVTRFTLPPGVSEFSILFAGKGVQASECGSDIRLFYANSFYTKRPLLDSPLDGSFGLNGGFFQSAGPGEYGVLISSGVCGNDSDDFEMNGLAVSY